MKTVITTPNKNYPFYTVMVGSDGNTLYKTGYDTKEKAENKFFSFFLPYNRLINLERS